jgi:thiol-disulfide isomerase/thioredoxin
MTYSCINCIRTFPFVNAWQEKYADDGLVIVGIHTPEFEFEKDEGMEGFGIAFPVALDNDYVTWRNFGNRFWPAKYLFDQEGQLRYRHFGEGRYEETELAIQRLLGLTEEVVEGIIPDWSEIRSRETYFGYRRAERFSSPETTARDAARAYSFPAALGADAWALEGEWVITPEHAESASDGARFRMRFDAGQMHLVMATADGEPRDVEVALDGRPTGTVTVSSSELYTVASTAGGDHVVELRVPAGVRAFAATFGDAE